MSTAARGDRRAAVTLPRIGDFVGRRTVTFLVLTDPNGCDMNYRLMPCRRAAGWLATFGDGTTLTLCAAHAAELWEDRR